MKVFPVFIALLMISKAASAQGYALGNGFTLGFTEAYAITGPATGFAISKGGIVVPGDSLNLIVSKPLYFNGQFLPALQPTGSETDVTLLYSRPIDPFTTGTISFSARQDVYDIADNDDLTAMIRLHHKF